MTGRTRKLAALATLGLCLLGGGIAWTQLRPSQPSGEAELEPVPMHAFRDAVEAARAEKKPILVVFSASW